MGDHVRWNGQKKQVVAVISQKDASPSEKESKFFEALRALDPELEKKDRSPVEDEFLCAMREWLDELDEGIKGC